MMFPSDRIFPQYMDADKVLETYGGIASSNSLMGCAFTHIAYEDLAVGNVIMPGFSEQLIQYLWRAYANRLHSTLLFTSRTTVHRVRSVVTRPAMRWLFYTQSS